MNAVRVQDSFSILPMDEYIDSLIDATIYSTLDVKCVYWQADIAEQDGDKMAFTFRHGLFRFTRMQYGLKNDLRASLPAMDVLQMKVKWKFCFGLFDQYRNIFADARQTHQVCFLSTDVIE